MIAYNKVDRISLSDIKRHPWVTNPELPTQQEVRQELGRLKTRFIHRTFEDQVETLKDEAQRRDVRLPKSFTHYLSYIRRKEGLLQVVIGMVKLALRFAIALAYGLGTSAFAKRTVTE